MVLALRGDRPSFQFVGVDYGKISAPMMIRSSSSVFPEVFVLITCITSEKMLRAARSLIANQHERSNSVELMLLAISIVPAMKVIFFLQANRK